MHQTQGHISTLNKSLFFFNPRKYPNTWRLNNTLLKIQRETKVIREEMKKFLNSNENENTTYQNLWNTEKALLRGKFIAISAYIQKNKKERETSQINNLMMHLKLLKKQEQIKPKISRQREIIKIRAKINKIETKQAIQRISKIKSWFFEKINKINT
jgi:hypothetical protein